MAMTFSPGQSHIAPRPPLMRRRGSEHDGLLGAFMVAVIAIGIVVGFAAAPGGHLSLPRDVLQVLNPMRAPVARPVDGVAPTFAEPAPEAVNSVQAVAPAAPEPAPAPAAQNAAVESAPASPKLVVGGRARVVNTDGQGVVLHAAPNTGARRPSGLLEGVTVSVLSLTDDGWARVESASRQSGWAPVIYLSPAD